MRAEMRPAIPSTLPEVMVPRARRDRLLRWYAAALTVLAATADAMYAPVVSRFHTYAVEVGAMARGYMDAVMALPAWGEWRAAALAEPWVLPEDEVDWPTVVRV